jgi:hypothetical protein
MSQSMTPEQEDSLIRELLVRLKNIESSLQAGDSVLIQPYIEGTRTTNAITVPGYDWSQIDSQLRAMCRGGLISSGTVPYDGAAIGIFFANLTPAGRKLLGR